MQRLILSMVALLISAMLVGCGAAAKMIGAKSQSERADVFTEVTDGGGRTQEFADLTIKASIKTHVVGYYMDEPAKSLHGKQDYPFVVNIDGQAAVWKVDGQKEVKPAYDEQGMTSQDPEAGTGIKYVLEKRLRLRQGTHKVFFGLPAEAYHVETEIALRGGEEALLEFKPLYWYRHVPIRIPTFLKGIKKYDIYLNGEKIG